VPLLRLAHRLIALCAMCSPPARLLIESLLVALNTVPAKKVRPIVRTDGLNHVRGFAITAFATVDCSVLDGHRLISSPIMFFCLMNAISVLINSPKCRDMKARHLPFVPPE